MGDYVGAACVFIGVFSLVIGSLITGIAVMTPSERWTEIGLLIALIVAPSTLVTGYILIG